MQIAARAWGVGKSTLRTEPGRVIGPVGQSASYGDLVALDADVVTVPDVDAVALKARDQFHVIGHDLPRRDVPAKSIGQAVYAVDVEVPNMAYGAVLRAPVEDELASEVDDSAARAVPGVIDIVALPDGIAIVAESFWVALGARLAGCDMV